MPSNGSAPSPSLLKMEGNRTTFRRRRRCSFGNIIGDPFALATISIAILAWLLAFVSSILAALNTAFPKFCWWTLVFMFFCIIGVTITIAADAVFTYHVAIVGYLAAGVILTSSATNQLVYSAQGASEAAAAGFILLSIVAIVWIFYFGSQPQATHRSFVDSFALHKGDRNSPHTSRQMSNRFVDQQPATYGASPPSQLYNTNHLNGLEASSPSYPGGTVNSSYSQQPRFGGSTVQPPQGGEVPQQGVPTADEVAMGPPAEYSHRAKAIYSYEANPDDPNEISFSKQEILEISDVTGRWWQARKANGETGIAPSNYLILL